MILVLTAVSVAYSGFCADEKTEPKPFPLHSGDCVKTDTVCYSVPDHDLLVSLLQQEIHDKEAAQARIRTLEAELELARHETRLGELRIQQAEARAELYQVQRGGFWHRHLRICGGLGAGSRFLGDDQGEIDLVAFGGICVLR